MWKWQARGASCSSSTLRRQGDGRARGGAAAVRGCLAVRLAASSPRQQPRDVVLSPGEAPAGQPPACSPQSPLKCGAQV